MSAIGGYFGLELPMGKEYHSGMIRLNTGRNALEYILIADQYTKIYLPYYTCEVLLEPIRKNSIAVEYYSIDEHLEPIFDFSKIKKEECFLYTNYFGFKDEYIFGLSKICRNLIVDNAQAFYSKPIDGVPTFYSPRKFFGVSDGAYLFYNNTQELVLEKDQSYERFEHLLKRIDLSAEQGYSDFVKTDNALSNLPVRKMSNLTHRMLMSIDYEKVAFKRKENYDYLSLHLKAKNERHFELQKGQVPMVYPFMADAKLRGRLIENKIYIGQYWKEVLTSVPANSIEYAFVTQLMHLPIDQRYDKSDLDKIIEVILS